MGLNGGINAETSLYTELTTYKHTGRTVEEEEKEVFLCRKKKLSNEREVKTHLLTCMTSQIDISIQKCYKTYWKLYMRVY